MRYCHTICTVLLRISFTIEAQKCRNSAAIIGARTHTRAARYVSVFVCMCVCVPVCDTADSLIDLLAASALCLCMFLCHLCLAS